MRHLGPVLVGLALLGLGIVLLRQDARIDALQAELAGVKARADEARPSVEPVGATAPQLPLAARPTPGATPSQPAPPAPRAVVSADDVARIESAVLSLLEADRPELREKLRAVVQEHQESAEREREEQRRERWVARTEARLSQLKGEVALSADQREALVSLLLATRDQIADVRRGADTAEAMVKARETVRQLRADADAQVRKLLQPAQHAAYEELMRDDDDDDDRRRRPARPE